MAPLPGSPEYATYVGLLRGRAFIVEPDPLRALALAIAYPRRGFRRLAVGIDAGPKRCGVAAAGDWVVLEATSAQCDEVPKVVRGLVDRVPHELLDVVMGSGTGWQGVAEGLASVGLEFTLVDESGSSGDGLLPLPLKDRDARAALSLLLR